MQLQLNEELQLLNLKRTFLVRARNVIHGIPEFLGATSDP
jgi:hypothetical protein